jgi:3-deoxy-manno-octulosonate cytidylyltransferase (CMP-KDO synthetase)
MNYAIIIPARFPSTRLPGKPLVEISGVPMIVRTWRQCVKVAEPSNVYVATDDQRVIDACKLHGIQALMTSDKCLTGTDRVAECAEMIEADVFINVQGDEPLFNPEDILTIIEASRTSPDMIINGYAPLEDAADYNSSQVPKVVVDQQENLIYMSRSPIPGNKRGEFALGWRQICAYAFPREALRAFLSYGKKTPLESQEDIEILRFLELGFRVKMIKMSADSIPVDNPEDIVKVEARLIEKSEQK